MNVSNIRRNNVNIASENYVIKPLKSIYLYPSVLVVGLYQTYRNGVKKLRSNYVWKLRQDYVTKITLELRREVTLDLRQETTQESHTNGNKKIRNHYAMTT